MDKTPEPVLSAYAEFVHFHLHSGCRLLREGAWERQSISIRRREEKRRREAFFVNATVKTIIFWVFVVACLVVIWLLFQKR